MCTILPSSATRPVMLPRPGTTFAGGRSPSIRVRCSGRTRHTAVYLAHAYPIDAESAPQSRVAVSTTVSSTGCTSKVERLMTLSTSLVAVWYSSDSSRSRVRGCNSPSSRAFSIAMTAWSAKVRTSSICRSVNGSTRFRARYDAERPSRAAAAPQGWYDTRPSQPRSPRSPGRRGCPRRARPCLRALRARPCFRDRGQWFAGARSPNTRAPLHWSNSPHSGRPRPRVLRSPP